MGTMTVLRARKELEMDVDLEVRTEVTNVDYDVDYDADGHRKGFVTLYGTEKDGELYYIVLDEAVLEQVVNKLVRTR